MATVRALDENHDWTFGRGKSNYKKNSAAVAQNIDTRLNSYLGDCFFDTASGIDWFNLMGGKDKGAVERAVRTIILNTDGVTGGLALSISVDEDRVMTITYSVDTVYGRAASGVVTPVAA